jgi:hypothetical protein
VARLSHHALDHVRERQLIGMNDHGIRRSDQWCNGSCSVFGISGDQAGKDELVLRGPNAEPAL